MKTLSKVKISIGVGLITLGIAILMLMGKQELYAQILFLISIITYVPQIYYTEKLEEPKMEEYKEIKITEVNE